MGFHPDPATHLGAPGTATHTSPWPLIGRAAELAVIEHVIEAPGGVVIAGPPGVGKTRLAREAAALALTRGFAVTVVVASESTSSLPLGAFAHLLTDTSDGAASLARAHHALRASSRDRHLVLVVDDAHTLDPVSAALVQQLVSDAQATVVATIRTDAAAPAAVTALWKDELCRRIDVAALTEAETAALLVEVLGGPVDGAARRALWTATTGNVLFLRELVRAAIDDQRLVRSEEIWTLREPLVAPPSVRELVASRLAGLSPPERVALDTVTLGEPLSLSVARAAADRRSIERIETLGLVVIDEPDGRPKREGVVRLSHPLMGDVVRAGMSPTRRRHLTTRLAAALEATSPDLEGPDTLRIVVWRLEAGDTVTTDRLVSAARRCLLLDSTLAERLARLACERSGETSAVLVLAELLMFTNRGAEACELLEAALMQNHCSSEERRELVVKLANVLTFALGSPGTALTRLRGTLTLLSDPTARCFVLGQMAAIALFAGNMDETLALADQVLADPAATSVDTARVLVTKVPALAASGAPCDAIAGAGQAFAAAVREAKRLPYGIGELGAGLGVAYQWIGDLASADALARRGYHEGLARSIPLMRGVSALRLGQQELWRGRARSAAALLREATVTLTDVDAGFRPAALDHLAMACALLHDDSGARDALERSMRARRQPMYAAEHLRCEANVRGLLGEHSAARAIALEATGVAQALTQRTYAALCAYDAARFGAVNEAANVLDNSGRAIDSPLVRVMTGAASALCDSDAVTLDKSAREFEDLGFHLFAAELFRAAALQFECTGLAARCARATASAEGCESLCEGASTPMTDARPLSAPLTAREREVATLASQGLSDAGIAKMLDVSVRTVQTHLGRVYTKIGIGGRRELAVVFGPGGTHGTRGPQRRL